METPKQQILMVSLIISIALFIGGLTIFLIICKVKIDTKSALQPPITPNFTASDYTFSFFTSQKKEFLIFDKDVRGIVITELEAELASLQKKTEFKDFLSKLNETIKKQLIDVILLSQFSIYENAYGMNTSIQKLRGWSDLKEFNTLTKIMFCRVEIHEFPYEALSFFQSLENLELLWCHVPEINCPFYKYLPANLRELKICACNLKTAPDVSGFTKLHVLNLCDNKGMMIDDSVLEGFSKVNEIYLSKSELPENTKEKLKKACGKRLWLF